MPRRSADSVPRAFLFSDLRGYTAYVERHGDAAAARLLRMYRDLVRKAVAREEGAEIKTEGDSFYVVFPSGVGAVRCAMAIQRQAVRRHGEPLPIGIGIHAGEAAPFEAQYVGGAVNIAARLASAAAAGEILISDTVRGLIRTAMRVPLEDRGLLALKGVAEPIHAYAVRVAEAPLVRAVEPPRKPLEAAFRGDFEAAANMARTMSPAASPDERCEALVALVLFAAARGDIESALGRTEQLLTVCFRTADPSWVRAAYALRAWLYFLARQPGEASAELDRAIQRPGEGREAGLLMLLATTTAGSPAQAEPLRHLAATCRDPPVAAACRVVADALEGKVDVPAARDALTAAAAPFLAALVELQLVARRHGEAGEDWRSRAAQAGTGRLAELIFQAVQ